jgi:GntR family transcriptional regulator, rspAB operon transcriptional repressor
VTTVPNRADQAHADLLRRILLRQVPVDQPLLEERLAQELAVSRTPLREALLRLAADGLVVKHGRNWAVKTVTVETYLDTMAVRLLLEPEAARLAAGRLPRERIDSLGLTIRSLADEQRQIEPHWAADDALHDGIAEASGNPVLAVTIRRVRMPTRLFELARPFERVALDASEHLAILAAIADGDGAAAEAAMRAHLANLVVTLLERLGRSPVR